MAPGDMARLYHRLSSFGPARVDVQAPIAHPLVRQDFERFDLAIEPPRTKSYPGGLSRIDLPRDWPPVAIPATTVLAGHGPERAQCPLDLAGLGRLLHLSAGVVRTDVHRGRTMLFRAAGSAGACFPSEIYISARGIAGLADAVYWYDPIGHGLVRVGPAAGGAATTLVVTGVHWRTTWKYAERGFRHLYWDAGTMLAQTLALAQSGGLVPRLRTRFPDAEIARLVGADGVHELPIALVGLGVGIPAIEPRGDGARASIADAPVEFPLLTRAQRAGDGEVLGDPWPVAPAVPGIPPGSADLDAVILRRGSARRMDASATVAGDVFAFSIAVALRGTRVPHFVVVHAVEGLEPGLYRWPDLENPIRRGLLREELLWVCWDMDLARDAAFVVIGAIDLATLDDRGYRDAQLEAGLVSGRLHLAAYALGIGASGMTFLDTEVAGLLGEPLAGLLVTCVGVPTYQTTPGGRPGEPVAIVSPVAGETIARSPATRGDGRPGW